MSLRLEMRKFMPTHWNRNTHIIVTDYNWAFKDKLKGQALVIYVQDLSAINNIINDIKEPTKINAIVYENPYTSLETEDIDPNWGKAAVSAAPFLQRRQIQQVNSRQENQIRRHAVFNGRSHHPEKC